VAFTILLSSNSNQNMISFCDKLLKYFIKNFCSIYSTEQASYNIHALQHIVDDFHNYEQDNASAFPFENHMRTLKKTVRKAYQPLEQAVKRYKEQYNFNTFRYTCRMLSTVDLLVSYAIYIIKVIYTFSHPIFNTLPTTKRFYSYKLCRLVCVRCLINDKRVRIYIFVFI